MNEDIHQLEADRLAWSLKTFTEATPLSSLLKCHDELGEIAIDIKKGIPDVFEYADALMCLFDSAGRQGILPVHIFEAFKDKLEINMARKWIKNDNNTYSHVK